MTQQQHCKPVIEGFNYQSLGLMESTYIKCFDLDQEHVFKMRLLVIAILQTLGHITYQSPSECERPSL